MNTVQLFKRAVGATLIASALAWNGTAWASPKILAVYPITQTSPIPTPAGSNAIYQVIITNNTGAAITGTFLQTNSLPAGVTVTFAPNPIPIPGGSTTRTGTMTVAVSPGLGSTNFSLCVRCQNTSSPGDFAVNCGSSISIVSTSPPSCSVSGTNAACPFTSGLIFTDTTSAVTPKFSWNVSGNGTITGPATNASVTVNAGAAGSFTVNCTVTDLANGKSNSCSKVVALADATPPTITQCATNLLGTANGSCQAAVPNFTNAVVASDNCGVVTITQSPVIGTSVGAGTNTITISVADQNGNTNTCSAKFIVRDLTVPTISQCAASQQANAGGAGTAPVPDFTGGVSASDNCGITSITQSPLATTAVSLGTNTITLTVADAAGNSTNCTTKFIVVDNTPPSISQCATNQSAQAGIGCQAPVPDFTGGVTASDNSGSVTITQTPVAGTLVGVGPHTVTLTATDGSSNSTNCTATFTVTDTTVPSITQCAANVTVNTDAGTNIASNVNLGAAPTASDLCGIASISSNAPATFPAGTNTVIWTITDNNSNAATCTQLVVVVDNQPPQLTCPANIFTNLAPSQCSLTNLNIGTPVASDNVGLASVTSNAPAVFNAGTNEVIWTATDTSGNSAVCTQIVAVLDVTAPQITQLPTAQQATANSGCQAAVPNYTSGVVASDDCTGTNSLTVTQSPTAGTFVGTGTNVVTITVTDQAGNPTQGTVNFIVADNTAPQITTCPTNQQAAASGSGTAAVPDFTSDVVATDNCGSGGLTVTQSPTAGTLVGIGAQTVTLTVTDGSGNSVTCTVTFTVVDNTPPLISQCASNQQASASASCQAAVPNLTGGVVASDNSGSVTVTQNPVAGTLVGVGPHTITLTVTDGSTNSVQCTATLTVVDNTLPSITCPANVTLVAGPGQCTVSNVNLGAASASDNCGIATVTSNAPASFAAGITLVTWTATDVNGNTSTCQQTVTILDQESPSITCPTNLSVFIDVGQCTASNVNLGTPLVTDNCTATFTNNAPALFPIGTNVVTWTATDPAGNSNTCQQLVVVIDPVAPVAVGTNITASLDANGQAVVLGSQLNGGSTDNCGIGGQLIGSAGSNVFTCADLGTNFVNYIVTDQSGNSATTSVAVVIADTIAPTIVCTNITVALGTNGTVVVNGSQLDGGSADNCGVTGQLINGGSSQTFTAANLGTNSATFIASDASGNSATCTATVVVTDNTPPTIACPADLNIGTTVGLCGATGVVLGSPTASDNAGIPSVTNNTPATFPVGTTVVTWTATDSSGNAATCQQSVTVTDSQAPSVTTCPANVSVNADAGQCTASGVALGAPTATDICDPGPFMITNNAPTSFPVGTNIVTWTIKDSSGNAATCQQTVTVTDSQLPAITCPATVNTTTDPNLTTASNVILGTPTTSDNCGVASVTNDAPSVFPAGTNTVTWTVTDVHGNTATCQQTVNVAQGNRPPTVINQNPSVNQGGSLNVAAPGVLAGASDPDGDPLTAFLVSAPSNGVAIVNSNGSYSYTPSTNFVGTDCFSYAATDGSATSAVATVCVNVGIANNPPVANNDTYSTAEDITLNVVAPGVLGNDTDSDTNALTAVLVNTTTNGTLTLNANGSFSYAPAANFHGSDGFTYKANDGAADSAVATVTITVTPVNDPPTVVNQTPSVPEDGSLNVPAPGVLAGASDPDGDTLTAILVAPASNGVAVVNSDGSYSYTPNANFNGTDCFSFAATDGVTTSAVATVCVTVSAANDAPVAFNDSYSTLSNTTLNVSAPGVLGNDTDVDGDTLTAVQLTGPTHGSVTLNSDGSFSYVPDTNYVGADSFTYKANDGTADSGSATVTINVTGGNTAPVANNDNYTVGEDDLLDLTAPGILGNDTDAESDPLTAILVSTTTNGVLTLNANGSLTYVPNDNFNGTDSFTYRASDGILTSGVATVTFTVTSVNGAGDIDLYAKSESFKINWGTTGRDQFKIKGKINPRGSKTDLAGATMQISVNGTNIFAPVTLDATGVGSATVGSTKIKAKLSSTTGQYSYTISGLDLRTAIGLPNTTGAGITPLQVTLIITYADLEVTPIRGTLETTFSTTAGKQSKGKFVFKSNRTLTGAFNWNKTTATQLKDGTFKVTGKGVIENEGGNGIAPTGNLRVTIGGTVFTIPTANVKFALNSTSRTFKISANELVGTGIPISGANGPTVYELPIMFEVPVSGGTNIFETIIELKRTTATSTKWKR